MCDRLSVRRHVKHYPQISLSVEHVGRNHNNKQDILVFRIGIAIQARYRCLEKASPGPDSSSAPMLSKDLLSRNIGGFRGSEKKIIHTADRYSMNPGRARASVLFWYRTMPLVPSGAVMACNAYLRRMGLELSLEPSHM